MNRHNVGFMAVDQIAHIHDFSSWKTKGGSLVSEGRIGTEKVILAKPQNFMNKSGLPVAELARFHKIKDNNIFVFHDELDLAAGRPRVKTVVDMAGITACVISTGTLARITGGYGLVLAGRLIRVWM